LCHALIDLVSERFDLHVLVDEDTDHALTDHLGDLGEQVLVLGFNVDVEGRAEFLAIGFQRLPESGAIMGLRQPDAPS